MLRRQSAQKFLGMLFIIPAASTYLLNLSLNQLILRSLTGFLSPDGVISANSQIILVWVFTLFMTFLLIFGIYLFLSPDLAGLRKFQRIFTCVFYCVEDTAHPPAGLFNTIPTILGIFLISHIFFWVNHTSIYKVLYLEDGIFETATPIMIFISCGLLYRVVNRMKRRPNIVQNSKWLRVFYWLLILALLFYAMEEISWGQRVFGWSTPEQFNLNSQNETNFHNFFNGWFGIIYRSLALVAIFPLLSLVFELKGQWLTLSRLVLPHASLFGIGFMVAFITLAFPREQELIEELLTVAVFFYSLRLNFCYCGEKGSIDTSTRIC